MARLRINALGGYIDAALTAAGTTLTSDALAACPAVASPDYVPIVLSPDGYLGGPYLAKITAHTAAATTATIEAVDTRAVDLPAGIEWVHAIQEDDFPDVLMRLIAETIYEPDPVIALNTTSTTATDVDAANLAVAFTVPASGAVEVHLSGLAAISGGGSNTELLWWLREGAADVAGSLVRALFANDVAQATITTKHRVTGLTPGASLTYKWGHSRASGTGSAITGCGVLYGPGIMRVYEVPAP